MDLLEANSAPDVVIEPPNDVGIWWEKDVRGAYAAPVNIAGELVDIDSLPLLSENDALTSARGPSNWAEPRVSETTPP